MISTSTIVQKKKKKKEARPLSRQGLKNELLKEWNRMEHAGEHPVCSWSVNSPPIVRNAEFLVRTCTRERSKGTSAKIHMGVP